MPITLRRHEWMVGVSAAMHFLVDGLCVCCLYLMLDTPGIQGMAKVFLTYNILAFMTQPLTGWMADRTKHRHWLLLAAVVLLAAAVMMASVVAAAPGVRSGVWLVALLLGTGNSLFHVWGGKQTVLTMGNDMRAMGVFVSTGAFVVIIWEVVVSSVGYSYSGYSSILVARALILKHAL